MTRFKKKNTQKTNQLNVYALPINLPTGRLIVVIINNTKPDLSQGKLLSLGRNRTLLLEI